MSELLTAIGLLLIIEGLLPFMSPQYTRKYMEAVMGMKDIFLRLIGLVVMMVGLVILYIV